MLWRTVSDSLARNVNIATNYTMEWFRVILRRRKVAPKSSLNPQLVLDNEQSNIAGSSQEDENNGVLLEGQKQRTRRIFSYLANADRRMKARLTSRIHSRRYTQLQNDQVDEQGEPSWKRRLSIPPDLENIVECNEYTEKNFSPENRRGKVVQGLETVSERITRFKGGKQTGGERAENVSIHGAGSVRDMLSVPFLDGSLHPHSPITKRSVHDFSPTARSEYSMIYYQRRNAICEQIEYQTYCRGINLKRLRNKLIEKQVQSITETLL